MEPPTVDAEDRCDQCARSPPAGEVRRASGTVALCEACLALEERTSQGPLVASWVLGDGEVVIEKVWPVVVNLHPFHVERLLEAGIEVPETLRPPGRDDG